MGAWTHNQQQGSLVQATETGARGVCPYYIIRSQNSAAKKVGSRSVQSATGTHCMVNFIKVRSLECSRNSVTLCNGRECDSENISWLKDLSNFDIFFYSFVKGCCKFADLFYKWVLEHAT